MGKRHKCGERIFEQDAVSASADTGRSPALAALEQAMSGCVDDVVALYGVALERAKTSKETRLSVARLVCVERNEGTAENPEVSSALKDRTDFLRIISSDEFKTELIDLLGTLGDDLGDSDGMLGNLELVITRQLLRHVMVVPLEKEKISILHRLKTWLAKIKLFLADIKNQFLALSVGAAIVAIDRFFITGQGFIEIMSNPVLQGIMGIAAGVVAFASVLIPFQALDWKESWQAFVLQYGTSVIFGVFEGAMILAMENKAGSLSGFAVLQAAILVCWAFWICGVQSRGEMNAMWDRREKPAHLTDFVNAFGSKKYPHIARLMITALLAQETTKFRTHLFPQALKIYLEKMVRELPVDQLNAAVKAMTAFTVDSFDWFKEDDSPVNISGWDKAMKKLENLTQRLKIEPSVAEDVQEGEENETEFGRKDVALLRMFRKLAGAMYDHKKVLALIPEFFGEDFSVERIEELMKEFERFCFAGTLRDAENQGVSIFPQ